MSSSGKPRFSGIITPIDKLTEIGGFLSGLCLLGIFVLIVAELFWRNVLAKSLHFSWDLAGYLMGACFLLACAAAMKNGAHVRVTALTEALSPRLARLCEIASTVVALAICVALSWALIEMTYLSWMRGSTAATAWRVPLVWPQSVLAIGAVLMTLQCVAQILRVLRGEQISRGMGLE